MPFYPPQIFQSFLGLPLQTGMIAHCIVGFIIDVASLVTTFDMWAAIDVDKVCRSPWANEMGHIIIYVYVLIIVLLGKRINIQAHVQAFGIWLIATLILNMKEVVVLVILIINPASQFEFDGLVGFLMNYVGAVACHSIYIVKFVFTIMSVIIFCSGTLVYWSYYMDMKE